MPRFSEHQEGGLLGHRVYSPPFTKSFDTYLEADAWLTDGGYRESIISIDIAGETTVTLEGEFALRAIDKERPLAPGGFRIREIESIG